MEKATQSHDPEYAVSLDLLPAVISTSSSRITSGTMFVLSADNGDIEPRLRQGFYAHDTRFLSRFTLIINDKRLRTTGYATFEDRLGSFYCHSASLSVVRDRYVSESFHEDISIRNDGLNTAHVNVQLLFDADFADIFEVRLGRFHKTGKITTEPRAGNELALVYKRGEHSWETHIKFSTATVISGKQALLDFKLAPKEVWKTCLEIIPFVNDAAPLSSSVRCVSNVMGHPFSPYQPEKAYIGFFRQAERGIPLREVPQIKSDDPDLCQAYYRAVADLRALRLRYDGHHTLAAGSPWFMAVFGRDSILSSIQTKILGVELMVGTLKTLASLQAKDIDNFREAEPGKIIHEVRKGELSVFEHVPHSRYYGSIDSTPLFLDLLWEAFQWTGDSDLLRSLLPNAEAALQWVDRYGDSDGDGFVEYQRRTRKGLRNQGWKDSGDSVSFADGPLAKGPVALAEVQGYIYDAKQKMAEIYQFLGDPRHERLRKEADKLKRLFNDAFWMPEEGYYAIALDGSKRQVNSIASNAGHCLWSGIIDEDKAPMVAGRLLAPDMFGGWGIRTLSTEMRRYDPLSYHNGSVWPHDNSMIAAGLMRYGFTDEAHQVAIAIFEAASIFPAHRLPELYAGYPRRSYSFPVPYPAANAPQAWACGALIYLMETMLGVCPAEDKLLVNPEMRKNPPFRLTGVPYRGQKLDLP